MYANDLLFYIQYQRRDVCDDEMQHFSLINCKEMADVVRGSGHPMVAIIAIPL
jgi:hypothetical protein